MLKKLLLVLEIIFFALTIAGSIYVILNRGEVGPEYAVIPSLLNMVIMLVDKNVSNKNKDCESK